MGDLLLTHGTIITQAPQRTILSDGAILIEDGIIVAVDETERLTKAVSANEVMDASGMIILPGLIDAHVHLSDILLRGVGGVEHGLLDWLLQVKRPGIAAMQPADHEIASALYCREALEAGVTTIVENDAEIPIGERSAIDRKLTATASAGIRHYYARGIRERHPGSETQSHQITPNSDEPTSGQTNDPPVAETSVWRREIEELIGAYHGHADGRQEIWVAPVLAEGMTDHGLRTAYELAADHEVMTTIHVAETSADNTDQPSVIERLDTVGSLGEHALLGHCVHVTAQDIRLLAETGTSVVHNLAANLRLGSGIAPVPTFLEQNIPLALGTDNAILSDTVNPIADLRLLALTHAGVSRTPGVILPQTALDLITIGAAQAINRSDELGSIEPGKRADLVLLSTDHPHMTPRPDPISSVVYQANGSEVDTVICDGSIVVRNGVATSIVDAYPDLLSDAAQTAKRIAVDAGLSPHSDP